MSSKKSIIRKSDTEKLQKIQNIIDTNFIRSVMTWVIAIVFLGIYCFVWRNDDLKPYVIIPIVAVITISFLTVAILEVISNKISKELSRRKDNKILESLNSDVPKKIKLDDFENVNFKGLLENAEIKAQYNYEEDVIFVTFIITGDDNCTKISKTVKLKRDDIVSCIEII